MKTQLWAALAMTTLSGTSAWSAPAVPRPSGATGTELVARVLVSTGKVELVDSAKHPFSVRDQLPVALTDVLKVAPQAFVVLVIDRNQQVVRIDDDVELPVKDIAVLHAGTAERTLDQQLEQLLTVSEKKQLQERLMGWIASPVAASAPGAGRAKDEEPVKSKHAALELPAKSDSKELSAPAPQAPPAPSPPARPQPARLSEKSRPQPPRAEAPAPSPSGGAPSTSPDDVAPKEEARAEVAEPVCQKLSPDPELHGCLVKELAGRHAPLKLRFAFEADGQLHLVLERGLPVPACATRWFKSHPSPCSAQLGQWQTLEVPLK